ncbi:hypothetical protein MSPP1_001326 [Malassezia sp. CBS 17886]|nr:hypothetical protein MSPP1_001326 [Malassezia sp. CBS 17886]
MRQKRAKAYRRLVQQYVMHYRFREPYQVLGASQRAGRDLTAADNTFAESLVRFHVADPTRQLGVALHGKVKPMITQCCMVALYDAEKAALASGDRADAQRAKATVALAKEWERRKCNHREALPPAECIADVVGPSNQHRYMLAADDALVRRTRRRIVPGLPMLHYSQSVLVLEPMSDVTERDIAEREQAKSAIPSAERRLLRQTAPALPPAHAPVKRRGAKAPNPLSVKKPKKEGREEGSATGANGDVAFAEAPPRAVPAPQDAARPAPEALREPGTTSQTSKRRGKKRGRGGDSGGDGGVAA